MIQLVYSSVILAATTAGAVAGLGGGVIIKPLLDLIGYHDATTIGIYSSVAVFAMCLVSIAKQLRGGFKFDVRTVVLVSVGSLVGGFVGERVFNLATATLPNNIVKAVQAGLLALTLVAILGYTLNQDRIRRFTLSNPIAVVLVGIALGSISVFLGIGGGPLNVAFFSWLFSYGMKESTVYSLATIFFSQISKLGCVAASGILLSSDMSLLPLSVVAAVAGGFIGTALNQRMDDRAVSRFYVGLMCALLALSCYNVGTNLIR